MANTYSLSDVTSSIIFVPAGGNTYVDSLQLTASVSKGYVIPAGITHIGFNCTEKFWVKYYASATPGTATIPGADITDGSSAELAPTSRKLSNCQSIAIISDKACIATITCWE